MALFQPTRRRFIQASDSVIPSTLNMSFSHFSLPVALLLRFNPSNRKSTQTIKRTNFFDTTLKTSSSSHTFTFAKSTSASQIILL